MFPSSDNAPRAFAARTTGSGAHPSLMGATVRLSQMKDARKADPVDARAPRWIAIAKTAATGSTSLQSHRR
jgi:hypothetical protein